MVVVLVAMETVEVVVVNVGVHVRPLDLIDEDVRLIPDAQHYIPTLRRRQAVTVVLRTSTSTRVRTSLVFILTGLLRSGKNKLHNFC